MSLLANKTGLIAISALLLFSCNKKDDVGLELQPEDSKIGVFFTEDLPVNTYAVLKNDSIATGKLAYLFAGAYHDPEFGDVTAEGYTQLLLKDENRDVTGFTSVDSVVLSLTYDYYYGDTTESQTIQVYKIPLSTSLSNDSTYFSVHASLAQGTRIDGDSSWKAKPVSNKTIKLQLDNTFGSDLLTYNATGKTNVDFLTNFLPGIELIPKDNQGAILRFKLYDNTSKVKIYYTNSLAAKDSFELLINSNGARFSRVTSVRPVLLGSGMTVTGVPYPQSTTPNEAYIQSLLGIRTKVTFPTLAQFKDSLGNIAINRAELVLDVNDPADIGKFSTIGYLNLIKLDNTGKIRKFLDGDGVYRDLRVQKDGFDQLTHSVPLQVTYNSINTEYAFNISSYVHAMLYKQEENNGLLIASDPLVNSSSVNRVLARGVKMRIYYTFVE